MDNQNLWIIAGTSEARYLIEQLANRPVNIYASVATEYGESLLHKQKNLHVITKRLQPEEMREFIRNIKPKAVIDATHPYARIVTENVARICEEENLPLLRVKRAASKLDNSVIYVDSMEQAAAFLQTTQGNIFLTTGSKDLSIFVKVQDYQKRIYVRILPMLDSLNKALELGYAPSQIICMQGPFSVDMNKALLKMSNAAYLVTKDSGSSGGFAEKLKAARKMEIQVIVIHRPEEILEGYLVSELLTKLKEDYKI